MHELSQVCNTTILFLYLVSSAIAVFENSVNHIDRHEIAIITYFLYFNVVLLWLLFFPSIFTLTGHMLCKLIDLTVTVSLALTISSC